MRGKADVAQGGIMRTVYPLRTVVVVSGSMDTGVEETTSVCEDDGVLVLPVHEDVRYRMAGTALVTLVDDTVGRVLVLFLSEDRREDETISTV